MAEVDTLRQQIEKRAREIQDKLEQQRATQMEVNQARREAAAAQRVEQVEETPGRTGLVSPESRAATRRDVASRGFLPRMISEATPATVGAAIGGTAGSALGPIGTVGGAAIGGTLGELVGQETGVTPESDVGLGLAAGAPLAGPVAGGAARMARRGAGGTVEMLPMTKAARSRVMAQQGQEELKNFSSIVLAQQRGMRARTADDIFETIRRADTALPWNRVTPDMFPQTRRAIGELTGELEKFSSFPEVRAALGVVRQLSTTMNRLGSPISFSEVADLRRALGVATERASSAGGVRRGVANRAFKAFADDLDTLAEGARPQKGMARMTRDAFKRARIEFAAQDLDKAIARFSKPLAGTEDMTINAKGMSKWLSDKTNPKHQNYDKQFVEALGPQSDVLKRRLSKLAEITEAGSPGGPGSLVVRGITAAGGATVGGLAAAPFGLGQAGAALGGIVGASSPEAIMGMLSSPRGYRILERAARLGKGAINQNAWATAMEATAQSARSIATQAQEEMQ